MDLHENFTGARAFGEIHKLENVYMRLVVRVLYLLIM